MRIALAFLVCGCLAWSASARAQSAKTAKPQAPASVDPETFKERNRAEHAERQAKQTWLAADAESEKTTAVLFRFLADTAEEMAAWDRVAKVAAKQVALAKEMKDAWMRLERAEQLGPKGKALPKRKGVAFESEADASLKQLEAKGQAQGDAWNAWEQAKSDLARLPDPWDDPKYDDPPEPAPARAPAAVPAFDPDAYVPANGLDLIAPPARVPAPSSGPGHSAPPARVPAPSSGPGHSWWCGVPHSSTNDHPCKATQEACEHMREVIFFGAFSTCIEWPEVSIVESQITNGARVYSAYQYLSECEKDRKHMLKNKVDYRWVGKCRSSRGYSP